MHSLSLSLSDSLSLSLKNALSVGYSFSFELGSPYVLKYMVLRVYELRVIIHKIVKTDSVVPLSTSIQVVGILLVICIRMGPITRSLHHHSLFSIGAST